MSCCEIRKLYEHNETKALRRANDAFHKEQSNGLNNVDAAIIFTILGIILLVLL